MRAIRIAVFLFTALCGLFVAVVGSAYAQPERGAVYLVEIEGVINPPVANYLLRVLEEAARQDARLVVVQLDTPGGLDRSMREMTQAILASPVPVAVYVAPPGARAASAGLFILVSAHVAAMAPSTNTGAAHPVGLGGEADEVMMSKVVNDAAATIRTLAEQRGRNAQWSEQAVRESVSITENEAQELNVIEIVARDLDDLLRQVDGLTVETASGEVTVDVAGAPLHASPMHFAERFLHVLTDPDIAFILLSVGSIGLIAELYNPGALFPGITGVISLILAFYSLGNLPTNWAGVALIVLAVILFTAELSTDGTGVLGGGAVIAFLLGGLFLFRPFQPASPALPDLSVSPWLVVVSTGTMAGFIFLVLGQVMRTRQTPVMTGYEHYAGQIVVVHESLKPRGRVRFQGQLWFAEGPSGEEIAAGRRVKILGVEDLTLIVEPVEDLPAESTA
ncbi:MAG TPA: nodulation protein NfeD [Candidatus Sulfomarinibacteraceae bacterium]|nr:nodulation protein NfeD [Candidatus Sulfomarinibacteraceae bacterium]